MKNRATLCPAPTPRATGFQALAKDRRVWVGNPGSRVSKSEPAGRENWRREGKSGGPLPAWWVQAARGGIRAGPWSPPRRDLCGLPPARTPRSSSEKTKAHEAAFDASRLSQGCTVCVKNTEPGLAGAGPKSPRKLRRGHRTRPQDFRGRGRTGRPLPGVRGKL